MPLKLTSFALISILSAGVLLSTPAVAQDAKIAKKAISATGATDSFDLILPQAALTLKNRLSGNNPDKSDEIDDLVDAETFALAPRRAVLENEAAKLFSATFTDPELEQITAFFASPTGQKYLGNTPNLARELSKSARIWGTGIQRDLSKNVGEKLQAIISK